MINFIIVEFTLEFSCFCGATVIQVTRDQVLQYVLYPGYGNFFIVSLETRPVATSEIHTALQDSEKAQAIYWTQR